MPAYPYRMRDLVRSTGVAAPTIHFYAQQGLLPPAHKTAGNQARYPEATISRLLWIRTLQDELRLPLRCIRWILERWGELPVAEIRALQALGALLDEPEPVATAEDLDSLGALSADDVAALQRLGLISEGVPTAADVRLLRLCAAMRATGFTDEAGFTIENLAIYRDAIEQLVHDELLRIVEPVVLRHDPAQLSDLVRRGLPLVDQLLAILHQRAVRRLMQRWLELVDTASERASA